MAKPTSSPQAAPKAVGEGVGVKAFTDPLSDGLRQGLSEICASASQPPPSTEVVAAAARLAQEVFAAEQDRIQHGTRQEVRDLLLGVRKHAADLAKTLEALERRGSAPSIVAMASGVIVGAADGHFPRPAAEPWRWMRRLAAAAEEAARIPGGAGKTRHSVAAGNPSPHLLCAVGALLLKRRHLPKVTGETRLHMLCEVIWVASGGEAESENSARWRRHLEDARRVARGTALTASGLAARNIAHDVLDISAAPTG